MCGIAGIVHLRGDPVDPALLDRMTDALAHRGPEGRGIFLDRNVGLGHRRLKIIDLSENAAQPMYSDDRNIVLTFNGEIYNYREKRRMLEQRGYVFRSQSDTEVLLKLYEEFGVECLTHLRGMFAFAIYDRKRRQIFCARDRIGMKPFKYFFNGRIFLFASELKSLLEHPHCDRAVDETALHHFLTMTYVPAPHTGFQKIRKLSAAHAMLLDLKKEELKEWCYWSLNFKEKEDHSKEEWSKRIREKIDESVRMQMVADVPVGAFLSGGIDSSAVCTFMAKAAGAPIHTFSIGRGDAKDELEDALLVSKKIGSNHHPTVVVPDIKALLPKLIHAYEEPFADPSMIPTYLVSQFAKQKVTVCLNGDGGDENFAGYLRDAILKFSLSWEKAPGALHTLTRFGTRSLSSLFRTDFLYLCDEFERSIKAPWPERFLRYNSAFPDHEKKILYTSKFSSDYADFPTSQWYGEKGKMYRGYADDTIDQALSMDLFLHLADCLMPKVDNAAMAHALECRSPLLDHELLEMTARIPADLKLHGYKLKWIMKQALQGTLPREILNKKKQGFRLPLQSLFQGELAPYIREKLLSGSPKKWEIFERSQLEKFLRHALKSRRDYSQHIFTLLCLDEWFLQYT
ncbi:MAG TPA: asparagine synthase (glutamine-hydrolyzing) [Candidatus Peribacterales bacterium]|nr:asparagine synthase (glutamine-hydrolyzing) [Candidatus Peribacterales bacterium]